MRTHTHPDARRGGFTLLELLVAISILSVLAGVAVPATARAIQKKRVDGTETELASLLLSAGEYFTDTGKFPKNIEDLGEDPSVTGWAGPYVQHFDTDAMSGAAGYTVDGWGTEYRIKKSGNVLTLESAGPDRRFNKQSDNIVVQLDVTRIRREQTLAELQLINQAIYHYNQTYLVSNPLTTNWSSSLNKLVSEGYLPDKEPFRKDGWGDAYTADPVGGMPVMAVTSPNL